MMSPMYIEFGNDAAIAAVSDDDGKVTYQRYPGERVTRIDFPEGISVSEAHGIALAALGHHMEQDAVPRWVDSDSESLSMLAMEHFDLPRQSLGRPPSWGALSVSDHGKHLVGQDDPTPKKKKSKG